MHTADPATDRLFARLTWAVVGVGTLVRLVRFALPFPLWGDEVFVCQNFIDRDFATILHQLDNGQICPPLFLWAQLVAFRLFGGGELAMRLVPLLAGLGGLVGFARLARRFVPPLPAFLAVGFLAVGYWPVTLSTFAKPYSSDLLAAVVVLLAAVRWYERPGSVALGLLFAVVSPVAVLCSYTASFAFGGAAVALLPAVWRGGWTARGLLAAAGGLVAAAFAFDLTVGTSQLDDGPRVQIKQFLYDYWRAGFPPENPLMYPVWLLSQLSGRMFAYPVGESNGGSTITLLMFALGVWRWWKSLPRWRLALLLVPFGLNLLAALMWKYPFGGCARLTQYAAPAVCLLAGLGTATLIGWLFRTPRAVRVVGWVYAGVFAGLAVVLVGMAVLKPYHDDEAKFNRDEIAAFARELSPADRVVMRPKRDFDVTIPRYHLLLLGDRVTWAGEWPSDAAGDVWVVDVWLMHRGGTHTPAAVSIPPGWELVETRTRELKWKPPEDLEQTFVFERYRRR
jgi:4-amino-4-deoxy-L-arabinose transferase-like glycosyltransferase